MAKQEPDFEAGFDSEDEITQEKPKPDKKPVAMLSEEECRLGTDGESVYEKYLDYIDTLGGWSNLNDADKRRLNQTFKKKGRFGGGATEEVARSESHRQAIRLKKSISDSMYANANMEELSELQALNPDAKISFEIYAKGWKKFVSGLPED